MRGYMAIAGGFDVPVYLGSRSTFPNGQFGGYQGRYLRPGDSLPVGSCSGHREPLTLPVTWMQKYAGAVHDSAAEANTHVVGVLPGPHANPDYFKDEDIEVCMCCAPYITLH